MRARRNDELKAWITGRPESVWRPRTGDGEAVGGQGACRGVRVIEGSRKAFTLVVQCTLKGAQQCLDLGEDGTEDEATVTDGSHGYLSLATSRDALSDSEIVHRDNLCDVKFAVYHYNGLPGVVYQA